MKKILSLFTCIVLIFCMSITTFAAGTSVSLKGVPAEIKEGLSATVTVNLSGSPTFSSVLIQIEVGSGLSIVSGEWKIDGILKDFDLSKKHGVLALKSPGAMNGTVFSFVVKGDSASSGAKNITVSLTFKNGSSAAGTATGSESVKVACTSHKFGAAVKVDGNRHKQTCTACGYEEIKNHSWNGGSVTKPATCKESGSKTYTCTVCNAERKETISKTDNHKWGNWNITKQPGCTTPGTTTKTCSVCGKTEGQQINATGHSMGAWSQSKAPSCTAKGEEKRSCSKCGHTETRTLNALGHSFSKPTVTKKPTCTESGIETGKCTRCGQTTTNTISATGHKWSNWSEKDAATCTEGGSEIRTCSVCKAEEKRTTDALGHDFENPVIVKEPTIASTGLKEGKCKRCGETTSEIIPCSAKDEKTGTSFETKEGVFDAGVELKVEEITKDNPTYESVKSTLKNISEEFRLYDITATLNGEPVQPNGTVNATFTVPEGFGKDTAVFYIAPDGTYEKIDATLGNDGKTISAEISHFSSYAVCKLCDGGGQGGEDRLPKTSDDYIIYAVIAAAAIAAIGGITVVVIVVRKKKAAR